MDQQNWPQLQSQLVSLLNENNMRKIDRHNQADR